MTQPDDDVTEAIPIILHLQLDPAAMEPREGLFREAGYREVCAGVDADLVPLLNAFQPALVLVNAGASCGRGVELCRLIKGHPDHRHRMVLVLSRVSGAKPRIAAFDGGADGYLAEPAEPEELLAQVRALLRRATCDARPMALPGYEQQERLPLFLQYAPVGLAMMDREMRYLAVSRRWIDDYGPDECAWIGRSHGEVFPDMPESFTAAHAGCLAGASAQGEEQMRSPRTGAPHWFRWDMRPWRHADGCVGGTVLFLEDITRQKEEEAVLRRSQAFIRQVIDIDPNFIFAKDRAGRFTLVNQAVADCYGTTVHDLIGKTDADFNQRLDEVEWFRRLDQEVIETGRERRIPEEVVTDAAGHPRWLQTVKRPILDEQGRVYQVLGVSSDITLRKQAEESLVRQLYLMRTIMKNSAQALFVIDERGLCTFLNPAAEAMFGFTLEEIRVKPLHEMIHHHHPDGRPYPVSECAIHRALFEARAVREHEDVFIRKTGERFPVLVAASPIMDKDRPVSTVLEVRDITEQIRGKQALARISDQLRLILRSAGEGIYGVDLDGLGAFINPAGAAMFGYREEELLGQNLHNLLHRHHADGSPYPEDQCPLYAVLRHGRGCSGDDQTFWTKDGNPMAVSYTCSPMVEHGRVVGAVMVLRDIRERKRAQEALREGEERLRLALAAGQMGAWDVDLATGKTRWDAQEFALFGEEQDCVVPHPGLFYERVHPEDRVSVQRQVQAAIEHGELQHEFRVIHPDGRVRWLASRGLVLKDHQGRPHRMVGVNFDVTDRKRMEERLRSFTLELEWRVAERTEELQQSQERLRALATELNLAEQRERKRLATDLHDYLAQLLVLVRLKLGQIKRAAASGADMATLVQTTEEVVNEALAYTRTLVAQLSPPVLHEFGLPPALKWLSQQMLRQELSVSVTQLVPDNLPLPEDQAVLLFQSVRELLMNVRKHAGTHEAMVTMEHHHNELHVTVRDYGAGMDLAAAAAAEPSSPLSSKFGLFSIRERMRAIGGRFEFESSPGSGTVARLVVPLALAASDRTEDSAGHGRLMGQRADGEQAAELRRVIENVTDVTAGSSSHDTGPLPLRPRIRVLLVDDHMMIREGLRTLLKDYSDLDVVGEAWDGEEAVAFADRLRPDVVMMDVNMPRMDGIEATRRIKAAFRSMAVIGLSVNASVQVAEAMVASGADAFLSKEAAGDQIYQAIKAMGTRTVE